jgi:hypothetical protein
MVERIKIIPVTLGAHSNTLVKKILIRQFDLIGLCKGRLIGLILFDCVFTGEIEMTIDDEKDPRKTRSARRKSRSTRRKTKTLEY